MKNQSLLRIATTACAFLISGASMATTAEIKVNGLVCGFCAQGISKTFKANPATEGVYVSLENRLVAVQFKPGQDIADGAITKSLKDAGYSVVGITRSERALDSIKADAKNKSDAK
jgi:copper chaperone CopZ